MTFPRTHFSSAALLTVLLTGCGVPDDALMSDLDEDELVSLCEEITSEERSVTCSGDGYEITIDITGSVDECVDGNDPSYYDGCDATAGDVRACSDAWDALTDEDICGLDTSFPAACDPILECVFGV